MEPAAPVGNPISARSSWRSLTVDKRSRLLRKTKSFQASGSGAIQSASTGRFSAKRITRKCFLKSDAQSRAGAVRAGLSGLAVVDGEFGDVWIALACALSFDRCVKARIESRWLGCFQPSSLFIAAPSFNGRTADSGSAYRGSNPWGAANLLSHLQALRL